MKRILVVEDNQSVRKTLTYRLRKLGFVVTAAEDGREGLERARRETPHLIILDLMLPELSGEEVCRAIREDDNEALANIPIIMLTAKTSDVDRIVGKVLGANSYLTKPFETTDLLKEIRRFTCAETS